MAVSSKDVPDLLRLIVNKMEIIERHAYLQVRVPQKSRIQRKRALLKRPTKEPCYLQEQQHEELRGSFLRLRAAVADLTYSASYSSGVGSRYGAGESLRH